MNTLPIETEKKKLKIPVPFFSKSKDELHWLALLDEKTVVSIYNGERHKSVTNSDINLPSVKEDVVRAWEVNHSCTETEFLDKYDAVIESISLHPKLAV